MRWKRWRGRATCMVFGFCDTNCCSHAAAPSSSRCDPRAPSSSLALSGSGLAGCPSCSHGRCSRRAASPAACTRKGGLICHTQEPLRQLLCMAVVTHPTPHPVRRLTTTPSWTRHACKKYLRAAVTPNTPAWHALHSPCPVPLTNTVSCPPSISTRRPRDVSTPPPATAHHPNLHPVSAGLECSVGRHAGRKHDAIAGARGATACMRVIRVIQHITAA